MNNGSVNLHSYCSELLNLHNYIWIDVDNFLDKIV